MAEHWELTIREDEMGGQPYVEKPYESLHDATEALMTHLVNLSAEVGLKEPGHALMGISLNVPSDDMPLSVSVYYSVGDEEVSDVLEVRYYDW